MRVRTFSAVGLGVAALVLTSMAAVPATAASPSGVSMTASGASASAPAAVGSNASSSIAPDALKCGTGFGSELPTPDGLIAWNDGGAFNTAGGADVKCPKGRKKRNIKQVSVLGYFGAPTETFHVTFWSNSTAGGTNEPADGSAVICDYPAVVGTAGGQYPVSQQTDLALPSKCLLKKGINWVSVQNVNAGGPWYWEMQQELGGTTRADWVDRGDAFGSGCTIFDNDRYLLDCLGYDYPDFMLALS